MQPGALVNPRRQDHNRALIKDDIKLETEIANRVQYFDFVGLPGRDDYLSFLQRCDTARFQFVDEVTRNFARG
jgi:hypothetical protein